MLAVLSRLLDRGRRECAITCGLTELVKMAGQRATNVEKSESYMYRTCNQPMAILIINLTNITGSTAGYGEYGHIADVGLIVLQTAER